MDNERFDVIVVGGGPAGATAATFVAMQGHRVLLIERHTFPIYKIGESLLPSTIHGICAMLGVSEEIKAANFVRKLGGTFRWGASSEPWTFAFAASPEFPGPASYAYQVERMKFDTILIENAKRKGVDVRERHAAAAPIVSDGRVVGLEVIDDRDRRVRIGAGYVVDASGFGSTLARTVGARVYSKFFRNVAVFGYFLDAKRLAPPMSGNIFCAAFDKGWFWYIPLSDRLTSVGAVIGEEYGSLLKAERNKEQALAGLVAECQPIRDLLAGATPATEPPYAEVRVRSDYSYCHTAFWKPGLVLVGDAACFVDPVFSSGVHLATYSGLLAARSINTWLASTLPEEVALREFQRRYLREYSNFHDFLVSFYDTHQTLDGYYWAARRVLGRADSAADAFLRLVGGIGGSQEPLLAGRSEPSFTLEQLSRDLFPQAHGAGTAMSGSIPTSRQDRGSPRAQFMASLTAESTQMQLQARSIPLRQRPLFDDGLVPSADGFHWAIPESADSSTSAAAVNERG